MRTSSLFLTLALAAGLPLVLGFSYDEQGSGDAFTRERGTPLDSAKDALENAPAPALVGKLWQGTPVRLTEHVGDVVLVQFWDSLSPTAALDLTTVDSLVRRLGDKGLVAVGIHPQGHTAHMLRFLQKHRIGFTVCVDGGPTQSDYAADGTPDYYLIDRFGTLRMADLADADVEEAVGVLLAEPHPGG